MVHKIVVTVELMLVTMILFTRSISMHISFYGVVKFEA